MTVSRSQPVFGSVPSPTREAEPSAAELLAALREIEAVAPSLPDLYRWIDLKDVEGLFDNELRHVNGKKPFDYLKGWLSMLRPFAFASKDDSWGEMEKLLCIVMRNYVRMIAATDKARASLLNPLLAKGTGE